MLDAYARRPFDPYVASAAEKFSQAGLTGAKITALAFATGLIACFCAGLGQYIVAIILLLLHRFLSAAATAQSGKTAIGTLADFTVFGAFVLFFYMGALEHGLATALAIFSFMTMGMAYLAYGQIAAQKGMTDAAEGGLIGQTEMLLFMIAACVFPAGFSGIAGLFALLCFATAIMRVIKTVKMS